MHENRLLNEVLAGAEDHIAAFGANIVHQLEEGPVVVEVPEQIRKKNQERGDAAEPEPFVEQKASLRGEEQADYDSEAKERDGVFLFESDARYHAKPKPITGVVAFYGQVREVRAAHP